MRDRGAAVDAGKKRRYGWWKCSFVSAKIRASGQMAYAGKIRFGDLNIGRGEQSMHNTCNEGQGSVGIEVIKSRERSSSGCWGKEKVQLAEV